MSPIKKIKPAINGQSIISQYRKGAFSLVSIGLIEFATVHSTRQITQYIGGLISKEITAWLKVRRALKMLNILRTKPAQ